MKRRHLASVLILLSIIFLPYWIYLPLLFASIIVFPFFWEGLVFAFFADLLYGYGFPSLLSTSFIALMVLIALIPIRERLRIHA